MIDSKDSGRAGTPRSVAPDDPSPDAPKKALALPRNAGDDARQRAEEHRAQLQQALDQSSALLDRNNARLLALRNELDRAHSAAAGDISRLSNELREAEDRCRAVEAARSDFAEALLKSETLRSFNMTKTVDLERRLEQLERDRTESDRARRESEDTLDKVRAENAQLRAQERELRGDAQKSSELLTELRVIHERLEAKLARERAKNGHEAELSSLRDLAAARRIEAQSLCLAQAEALLRASAERPRTRWEKWGAAIGLGGSSAERETFSGWNVLKEQIFASWHLDHLNAYLQDTMKHHSEFERRDPYQRADTLDALVAFDDVEFVRCAYVTLLGRQPDTGGEAFYTGQVRAGVSKLEILWRLRGSSEARDHDPGIAGLDRALKRAAFERRPLVGILARLVRRDADSRSAGRKAIRALMNAAAVNARQLSLINLRLARLQSRDGAPVAIAQDVAAASPGASAALAQAASPVPSSTPELDHLRKKSAARRPTAPVRG